MTPTPGQTGGTRARRAAKQAAPGSAPPSSSDELDAGTAADVGAAEAGGPTGATAASSGAPAGRSASPAARRTPTERAGATAGVATARRRSGPLDPDTLVALEEERDFLLASLDDLEREHDAGDVDDADYDALRDDYTARAAAAIRALDDHAVLVRAARSDRSWLKIAAVLLIVAIIGGGVGLLVASSSGERDPNGSLTGDIRASSLGEIQTAKGFTGQAQQALQAGDSAKAVELYQQAIKSYGAALDIEPNNVEALTYRGWLLHNIAVQSGRGTAVEGELDAAALESLDQALLIKPTYPDALVFRAVIATRQGRPADALADLNALPAGSLPSAMAGLVENVRQEAEAAVAAG